MKRRRCERRRATESSDEMIEAVWPANSTISQLGLYRT
jgi:hypothetical protein